MRKREHGGIVGESLVVVLVGGSGKVGLAGL